MRKILNLNNKVLIANRLAALDAVQKVLVAKKYKKAEMQN